MPSNHQGATKFAIANRSYFHHVKWVRALSIRSASGQVADFLKEEIRRRTWTEFLPGENALITELGIGRNTIRTALKKLEEEGWLEAQGAGRRRKIILPSDTSSHTFRVTLLLYSTEGRSTEVISSLLFHLVEEGYEVEVAPKSLVELGMNSDRVARMAQKIDTDAWIVVAGSRKVLDWFASQSTPTFALYGQFPKRPMAYTGPDKSPAFRAAIRRLVELGHQRIVFMMPEQLNKKAPSRVFTEVLNEMKRSGLKTGSFTLPEWETTQDGLIRALDSLFAFTPPTAIFFDQPREFFAGQQYLAQRGLIAPRDISLICNDENAVFQWSTPTVSCIRSRVQPCVHRVLRWVDKASRGQQDRRGAFTKAEFIEGGTIGPTPMDAKQH